MEKARQRKLPGFFVFGFWQGAGTQGFEKLDGVALSRIPSLVLSLFACCLGPTLSASAQTTLTSDFTDTGTKTYQSWKPETTAKADNGVLHLLAGAAKEGNGILFAPIVKRSAWVEANFEMRTAGADGAGIVFMNAAEPIDSSDYQRFGEWDEPNLAGALGIGFDTSDPPEKDPFNKNGNFDGRPEREVSLHWNDIERMNRFSPVEFRAQSATDDFVPVRVRLDFQTGGAAVSVWVKDTAIYDRAFLPGVQPMDLRVGLGAKSEKANGFCDVRNFKLSSGPEVAPAAAPQRISAIDREPITLTRAHVARIADLPRDNGRYGRIVAHLTLSEVSPRIDPWDRLGKVYIYDEKGQRFELIRFISSYAHAMDWAVDVSDFRPLLEGKKKVEIECVTYSEGWTASLSFDFYPGPADKYAYKVVNLWNGTVEIGNAKKPTSQFWKPLQLNRPKDAESAAIRLMVTGHGSNENTDNAAEFMPLERTLMVGSAVYKNNLWKTDVYLNPLRPQGGTWKYDRAGWAPGSVVDAWTTDISGDIPRGATKTVTYDIAPYVNKTPDNGNPAIYQFEGTAIFYRSHP